MTDPKELQLLTVSVESVLKAFELAKEHTSSTGTPKEYLHNRWGVALDILDRAVRESDLGQELWEMRVNRGGDDITIGRPK